MYVVGIDIGTRSTKVVLLDGANYSAVIYDNGAQPAVVAAEKALGQILLERSLNPEDIKYTVATGQGRQFVTSATAQGADSTCLAKGIDFLLPSCRTVIDMGAKKCLVIKCGKGQVIRSAGNDRCAAGSGVYLESIADILGVPLSHTGELSLKSNERLEILSTCGVFAESEVISLIHSRKRAEDILMGVFTGIADRVSTLIGQLELEKDVAFTGGLARNAGMVMALERVIGCEVLVPTNPQIVPALGAALIAQERSK